MKNERSLTLRAGFSGSAKRSQDTIHWVITLINGETLIDLLIQHEIGVKKKTVDYYEFDDMPSRKRSRRRPRKRRAR